MILVDVSVPILDKNYDFWVDENMEIHDICRQLADMIASVEKSTLNKSSEAMLCDRATGRIFNGINTLAEYDIKDGAALMLV